MEGGSRFGGPDKWLGWGEMADGWGMDFYFFLGGWLGWLGDGFFIPSRSLTASGHP